MDNYNTDSGCNSGCGAPGGYLNSVLGGGSDIIATIGVISICGVVLCIIVLAILSFMKGTFDTPTSAGAITGYIGACLFVVFGICMWRS
jgi:hypothetical protein